MKYRVLQQQSYDLASYRICPIREQDMPLIKNWRNEQMVVLRQSRPLTDEDQLRYYHSIIVPTYQEEKPNMILFSFLLHDRCIGYGGLTNIDWSASRAEVSFLLETARVEDKVLYCFDFNKFLQMILKVSFEKLNFNRLFTETYDIRPWHVQVLVDNNFQYEGCLKQHIKIGNRYIDSLLHGCLKEYCDV